MKGLFHRVLPFLPDGAGACAAFVEAPALVLVNDMNGTLVTLYQRVGVPEGSPVQLRSTKRVREFSYVMGREQDFMAEYRRQMETAERGFELVVLTHGPVSAVVGVDLGRLAEQLEAEVGMPVVAVEASGTKPYLHGLSEAYLAVSRRLQDLPCKPREGTVNLLGVDAVDLPGAPARRAYADMLAHAARSEVCCDWCRGGGWGHWRAAAGAERNVVATTSALAQARALRRAWGQPFTRADELPFDHAAYGLSPTGLAALDGARVLVVGDQVVANLLRQALAGEDPARRARVQVAWFFDMDKGHMQPGDARLSGEADLAELAREGGFDAVLADPALGACLPPGTPLFPFRNLAVASGPGSGTPRATELRDLAARGDTAPWRVGEGLMTEPVAWTREWFQAIAAWLS